MRLIDGDALIDEYCEDCFGRSCGCEGEYCLDIKPITKAQTVEDAVVVVRCKDCAFYNEHIYMCKALGLGFPEDFYCACGCIKEDRR